MLVLVLDTATPAITAALAELTDGGEQILAERVTINARAHGELLAPHIHDVLASTGTRPADLAAIVAGLGPGPYTGLRAGLVTAAVFGMTLGIPTYGVGTLDAIGAATTGYVLVATDARRKEVYFRLYRDGSPGAVDGFGAGSLGTHPGVMKPADLAPMLVAEGIVAGVGEGTQRYAEVLGVSASEPLYPPPLMLARLASARVRQKAPSEMLTPLYLRKPDAVEPGARKPALT